MVHNNFYAFKRCHRCHKKSVDFPYIKKFWRQFVASLKDVELSCTVISGTTIGMISFSQSPLKMKYCSAFVAALKVAELDQILVQV
jgi:hypothetical protein